MIVCKQCGVELDDGMDVCPLCAASTVEDQATQKGLPGRDDASHYHYPPLLKRILWQIASVLLLSGVAATWVINFSIDGRVTWSIYPVTICLILLSYALVVALLSLKPVIQVITGWIVSGVMLMGVSTLLSEGWPLQLALPILCVVNLLVLAVMVILRNPRIKGFIRLTIIFTSVAVFCLITDIIISLYLQKQILLSWSVIVAACLLPATAAIVFMHFRTRNNRELQKIFHR